MKKIEKHQSVFLGIMYSIDNTSVWQIGKTFFMLKMLYKQNSHVGNWIF